jgi:hypothetical protein
LVITEADLPAGESTIQLVATTDGLVVATKDLKFTKESSNPELYNLPTCVFSAGSSDASVGVKSGEDAKLGEHATTLM